MLGESVDIKFVSGRCQGNRCLYVDSWSVIDLKTLIVPTSIVNMMHAFTTHNFTAADCSGSMQVLNNGIVSSSGKILNIEAIAADTTATSTSSDSQNGLLFR